MLLKWWLHKLQLYVTCKLKQRIKKLDFGQVFANLYDEAFLTYFIENSYDLYEIMVLFSKRTIQSKFCSLENIHQISDHLVLVVESSDQIRQDFLGVKVHMYGTHCIYFTVTTVDNTLAVTYGVIFSMSC